MVRSSARSSPTLGPKQRSWAPGSLSFSGYSFPGALGAASVEGGTPKPRPVTGAGLHTGGTGGPGRDGAGCSQGDAGDVGWVAVQGPGSSEERNREGDDCESKVLGSESAGREQTGHHCRQRTDAQLEADTAGCVEPRGREDLEPWRTLGTGWPPRGQRGSFRKFTWN